MTVLASSVIVAAVSLFTVRDAFRNGDRSGSTGASKQGVPDVFRDFSGTPAGSQAFPRSNYASRQPEQGANRITVAADKRAGWKRVGQDCFHVMGAGGLCPESRPGRGGGVGEN